MKKKKQTTCIVLRWTHEFSWMCWKWFLPLCVHISSLQTDLVHTATCCTGMCPHPSMLSYCYVTSVKAGQWTNSLLFFFLLLYFMVFAFLIQLLSNTTPSPYVPSSSFYDSHVMACSTIFQQKQRSICSNRLIKAHIIYDF